MVVEVAPDGPAGKAGLKSLEWGSDGRFQADLIVAIDGQKVNSVGELVHVLSQHRPGSEVTFTVLRGQLEHDFQMTLAEMPRPVGK